MAADLDPLIQYITALQRRVAQLESRLDSWATVTALAPLRVRLDGEASALDVSPVDLVGGLVVGDRVRVTVHSGQSYVSHKLGGGSGAEPPTWYATTGERDVAIPAPTTGTIVIVGSGAAMQVTLWSGSSWRALSQSLTGVPDAASFFTPASGISIANFAAEVNGRAITWQMSLSGLPAVGAGPNNVALGSVSSAFRPRRSFASWQGWTTGASPLMTGLCAADGAMTIRWSHAAVAAGANHTILGGTWPIPV